MTNEADVSESLKTNDIKSELEKKINIGEAINDFEKEIDSSNLGSFVDRNDGNKAVDDITDAPIEKIERPETKTLKELLLEKANTFSQQVKDIKSF